MGEEAAAFLGDNVGQQQQQQQPQQPIIPNVPGNTTQAAALHNVMAAMEESATSLASFDGESDSRRNSLHAQLVHAVGLGGSISENMDHTSMDEEVPHGHETSSGSSGSTNF